MWLCIKRRLLKVAKSSILHWQYCIYEGKKSPVMIHFKRWSSPLEWLISFCFRKLGPRRLGHVIWSHSPFLSLYLFYLWLRVALPKERACEKFFFLKLVFKLLTLLAWDENDFFRRRCRRRRRRSLLLFVPSSKTKNYKKIMWRLFFFRHHPFTSFRLFKRQERDSNPQTFAIAIGTKGMRCADKGATQSRQIKIFSRHWTVSTIVGNSETISLHHSNNNRPVNSNKITTLLRW